MKVLIIGSGGVGGYFTSLLCKSDFNLTLLCRGERYDFIKKKGLILNTLGKKIKSNNFFVTSELENKMSFDIIINTVKLYDFEGDKCILVVKLEEYEHVRQKLSTGRVTTQTSSGKIKLVRERMGFARMPRKR